MSELQISLLGIGAAVIAAVYIYNFWLQRQYQRKFGSAFKQHEDALYHGITKNDPENISGDGEQEKHLTTDKIRLNVPDEVCNDLHEKTDFIIDIYPVGIVTAEALNPLWHRRFDFGKNVNACGMNNSTGNWEKVIAESQISYRTFRLGLQLADRAGPVSMARLSDFRDLTREIGKLIQAEVIIPNLEDASIRAIQLDEFCAEVDRMIGINLLPNGDITLAANEIAQVAQSLDMSLQADGAFHLLDTYGYTLYSLCNVDSTPFQHHTFNHMRVKGLTLLLDVPRVEFPARRFDEMLILAKRLARDLGATVVDDERVVLSDYNLAQIGEQIISLEKRMLENNINPGSPQARRLFA